MDRFRELKAFTGIIELGSMAAAAASVGMTPSALSKLLKRIEAGLGVTLVNRTTRRLTLTSEGEAYYEHARVIVDALEALDADLMTRGGRPRGLLRISCGIAFGIHTLCRILPEFARRYPEVKVDLQLTDRVVDLLEERVDIAVRIGKLSASSLVQRKLGEMRRVICASPDYLAAAGVPRSPEDLASHRIIALTGIGDFDHWPFRAADGGVRRVKVAPSLTSDTAEAVLQLGLAGGGIFRLGDNIVGERLRDGRLRALLKDTHYVEPLPVSLVFSPQLKGSPRVRAFVDFIVERMAG